MRIMYKSLRAKKDRCCSEYLCIFEEESFIIESAAATTFYPLHHRLFCIVSLCTLRIKLTRNLDAWLLLAGKKIYILCSPEMCCVCAFRKPDGAKVHRTRLRSVSYCRIQPINTCKRARARARLTHL